MMKHPFQDVESLFGELPGVAEWRAIDVMEADGGYRVSMDLPGYDEEDIEVRLADQTLHIEAEREAEIDETEEYLRQERHHRTVSRSVQFPELIEEDTAEASYQNGVLTVTVSKAEESKTESHTIPVK